ncbi:MAG: GAF domain-containing protein [Proteobacteria bacterium]|nr:GAF domain-containing protein [Pseudomonadota bacterium]
MSSTDPRLEAYTEAALAMESGNFDVEVPVICDDEMGVLGEALVRLGHALERKYQELHALLEVGERANEGLLLDEVCDHVYDAFRNLIPYHRMGLALISDDGAHVAAYWARNDGALLQITRGFEAPLAGSSLNTILETGQSRILNDLPAYLAEHPGSESTRLIVAEGIGSSLTCPLISQGHAIGFLFFSSRGLRQYEDAHVRIFQQIAGHLAGVIEKSRLYGRLLELGELKNRLLGMAAHDMRSPLTVILGWVDMLRCGLGGALPAKADGALEQIESSAEQVLRLVEDLLDVSVIEAGRLELNRQPVDLITHLRMQAESAALLAQAKSVGLELDLPDGEAIA